MDITGKFVMKKNINNEAFLNLDFSTLKKGMYVLKIYADNDFYVSKVLKY